MESIVLRGISSELGLGEISAESGLWGSPSAQHAIPTRAATNTKTGISVPNSSLARRASANTTRDVVERVVAVRVDVVVLLDELVDVLEDVVVVRKNVAFGERQNTAESGLNPTV